MKYYTLTDKVMFRREHFGALLFNKHQWVFEVVNRTGADILSLLTKENLSRNEIVRVLSNIYYTTNSQIIARDINIFLDGLLNKHYATLTKNRRHVPSIEELCDILQKESFESFPRGYLRSPAELNFYPTYGCNQSCSFCYLKTTLREQSTFSKGQFYKRLCEEAAENKVFAVGFLGGEPLLLLDDIIDILIERRDVNFSLTTNGSANGGINMEQAKQLSGFSNLSVTVSIHSLTSSIHDKLVGSKGAHKTAIRTVKNLLKAGFKRVCVATVATRFNIDEVISLMLMVKQLGVKGFRLSSLLPFHAPKEEFWKFFPPHSDYYAVINLLKEYRNRFTDFFITYNSLYYNLGNSEELYNPSNPLDELLCKCEGGVISLEVAPNGDVFPCCLSMNFPNFSLGNLVTRNLKDLWKAKKLSLFRKRDKRVMESEACNKCINRKRCGGGCVLASLILTNSLNFGDPRCPRVYREAFRKKLIKTAYFRNNTVL